MTKSTSYTPNPIDTSHIQLPDELEKLVERLAEHVHDIWAENRIEQGWRWGPERDDDLLQHPCLISYAQLSEEEKHYDRESALETLRLVKALGYEIIDIDK
jgi:hypothetical protein